jgi:hypothetical protein
MPKNGTTNTTKTNIEITRKGNLVILTINMDKFVKESASGKSILIATSGGGIMIGDAKLNLNLYKAA